MGPCEPTLAQHSRPYYIRRDKQTRIPDGVDATEIYDLGKRNKNTTGGGVPRTVGGVGGETCRITLQQYSGLRGPYVQDRVMIEKIQKTPCIMTGENRPPLQAVLPGYSAGPLAGKQKKKRRTCSIATMHSRLGPRHRPKNSSLFLFIRTFTMVEHPQFKLFHYLTSFLPWWPPSCLLVHETWHGNNGNITFPPR